MSVSWFVFCWIFENNCPEGGALAQFFCPRGRVFALPLCPVVGNSPLQKIARGFAGVGGGMFRLGIDWYINYKQSSCNYGFRPFRCYAFICRKTKSFDHHVVYSRALKLVPFWVLLLLSKIYSTNYVLHVILRASLKTVKKQENPSLCWYTEIMWTKPSRTRSILRQTLNNGCYSSAMYRFHFAYHCILCRLMVHSWEQNLFVTACPWLVQTEERKWKTECCTNRINNFRI